MEVLVCGPPGCRRSRPWWEEGLLEDVATSGDEDEDGSKATAWPYCGSRCGARNDATSALWSLRATTVMVMAMPLSRSERPCSQHGSGLGKLCIKY